MSTVYLDFRLAPGVSITEGFLDGLLRVIPEFEDAIEFDDGFTYDSVDFTTPHTPSGEKRVSFFGRINNLSIEPHCNYYFIQLAANPIPPDSEEWRELATNAENQGMLLMNDAVDYVTITGGLITGHKNFRPDIITHHFKPKLQLVGGRAIK